MIALEELRQREERERCPLCGLPKDICRDIELDNKVPVTVERCHVLTAIRREQTARTQGEKKSEYVDALDFLPKIPLGNLAAANEPQPLA